MQAQSPYLKLGKDSSSSTSPRKRKLQSQVASTSNNSNEYDNIHLLSGENRAAKAVAAVAVGGSGIAAAMDIGHLLSDLAAIPEQDSPYYHHRGGVTPSPIYPLRKDRDALTEKIQLLEKQIKTLQQSNRELSMKRVFEQESFRQTLKVERGKLEKVITSLSTKLRDRNELISEWISFVLNQPQFLNESTFFQSNHLLEIMNRTILVLPKLKSILKPTMDSINEFETNRKSRESSTNPNLFRNEGELFGEYAEGENPDDDFKVSPMTAGEEGKAGGSGRKKQKKRTPTDKQVLRDILANQELLLSESDREGTEGGGGGSAGNRRKMMTGDSDAEELLSAIDEQMKAISFLNNEQSDRQVSLSTDDEKGGRHKHVMFRDSSDQDISDSDQNPSTKKKGGKKQKKGAVSLKGAPPLPVKMGNAVTFAEKHQTQRTKRVEEENVTSAEIGKLLYESQVMHNNIFQISKEAEQQQVDKNNIINNHNQLQNHRNDNNNNNINSNNNSNNINSNSNSNPTNNNTNIFNTLFRDTPEASIDKLLVGKDEMKSASAEPDREKAEEAVPVNQQDQSAAITKEGKDGRKEGEEANAGAVKEEKKTTTAVVAVTVTNTATAAPTPSSNTLLSPATLKLIEANRKLNTVDEFMKSIDSEDFSYDEVLKELFDSVSGLSGSIEDIDDDTNQLISKTTQSPKSKGSRKNKAGKRGSGDFGVKAPRDSGLILNTPLSNPQDMLMKLKDAKINNKDASSGTMPQPLHPTVLAETSPSRAGASSSGSHAPAPAPAPANQKEVHNDQQSPSATSILPGAAKKAKKKGSLKAKERRGSETVKEEDDAEVDAENLAAGGVISQADHEKLLRSTNRLIENIQQFVNQSQAATNDPPSSPKSKSVVGAAKPSDQSKSKAGSSETASSDFNSLKLGGQLDNDP